MRGNGSKNGHLFSNVDWCDNATVDSDAYGMAKAGAERLAREWVASKSDAERPRYVSINPSMVFGPMMSKRHLNGSMAIIDHLLKRKPPVLLKMHMNIVDVRDVALAHVRALTEGKNGGRYIVFNDSLWMPEVNAVLRKYIPDRKWPRIVLPKTLSYVMSIFHPQITMKWVKHNVGTSCGYDSSPAVEELGIEWRSIESSIVDGARSAIDNQWR